MRPTALLRRVDRRLLASVAQFGCQKNGPELIRLGNQYGGWWIPEGRLRPDSIVYSVGVGEDISFDLALIARFGCTIHAFDPTPRAIAHCQGLDVPLFLEPVAIWKENRQLDLYFPEDPSHVSLSVRDRDGTGDTITVPAETLSNAMGRLGHDHIDLLKMDIEGAEAEVMDDLIHSGIRPSIITIEMEAIEPFPVTLKRMRALERTGYARVKVDGRNVLWLLRDA